MAAFPVSQDKYLRLIAAEHTDSLSKRIEELIREELSDMSVPAQRAVAASSLSSAASRLDGTVHDTILIMPRGVVYILCACMDEAKKNAGRR